ncbi:hypothetical protein OnM2_021098 [Erysiphe neolycopersici]|uniref:Uncharacterized protein n=1 Tax=Erysiphe neolycopersici TaxID=212602 RepID=A0A420I2X3_9PEZI|nr:hypothetical protein OnM2_021098 [Erysiphe neolycopersici]
MEFYSRSNQSSKAKMIAVLFREWLEAAFELRIRHLKRGILPRPSTTWEISELTSKNQRELIGLAAKASKAISFISTTRSTTSEQLTIRFHISKPPKLNYSA